MLAVLFGSLVLALPGPPVGSDPNPLSVVVAWDASLSGRASFDARAEATYGLVEEVTADRATEVALIQFNDHVQLLAGFPAAPDDLKRALEARTSEGRSCLFDCLWMTARELLSQRPGRRAIVVAADGEDNCSKIDLQQTVERLNDWKVPVYAVGVEGSPYPSNLENLRQLAVRTGGLFIEARNSVASLRDAHARIREALVRTQRID